MSEQRHDRPHNLAVGDLSKSKLFYEKAFLPLGYRLTFGKENVILAFDIGNGCLFEIQQADSPPHLTRIHIAFRARGKGEVDAFQAGARDNGAPRPRPEYAPDHYACFVLDPDGYNIEAMINQPTVAA
ncbi:catechol 2,3-dioxygenase-like lactoylglutathione lyase family enzyme [Rhizobium lentis]|uniref:Catechol 2,3-dioxygenase-like lactoylglutathione lyase family enzyme n=1 Tax=Rhizobium lentis TaxID=1138194 RepID=A0A7W8UPD2_9HYPH|nr:catechol 2,3-dioxygenase-like lactoylglutathione lyase family enzyme [Rhizobium lentis]MBB5549502.1 catechol 2,3-dioxygenase-like lactoylglutathione lyase family enzyme [Rhizobium lentis]MBB5560490.1 catechol 2,3-dioxygenase-like lactoylglutathione lyase family enzyme [Rhizobium lentis]MBB5566622.1 catechol 2,3-dioxygenase-like lactoylglutathione lyase family enzyme [Rhizobium lentis]